MEERPIISVIICTYNQEDYIEQAINSALLQTTSVPYEILIGDDCSTDSTKDIVNRIQNQHPRKVFVHHSSHNEGPTRNLLRLLSAAKGEYIATLDGDDYWSDPNKLQKQWEAISNDHSIGMICSYASILNQVNSTIIGVLGSKNVESFEKLILDDSDVAAPTLFIKKSLLEKCIADSQWYIEHCLFFDTVISYWFSLYSRIFFIPEVLAVYRVLPNSLCHSTNELIQKDYLKRYFAIKLRFLIENPIPTELSYSIIQKECDKITDYERWRTETKLRSTKSFKIGHFLLWPVKFLRFHKKN